MELCPYVCTNSRSDVLLGLCPNMEHSHFLICLLIMGDDMGGLLAMSVLKMPNGFVSHESPCPLRLITYHWKR